MGKIARAGIAIAAVAGLAVGVWLALRPRPPVPPANDAKPAAANQAVARPTAARPFAVADDSPILRVLDRDTGAPIDGAWVEFVPEGSDEDREEPNAARIRAGMDGFVRVPLAVLESKDWLDARIGAPDHLAIELERVIFCALFLARAPSAIESAAPISIPLPPGIERQGHVIDQDGVSIGGVRILACGGMDSFIRELHPTLQSRFIVWSFEGVSDEDGRFRIRLPGDEGEIHSIRLHKSGYMPAVLNSGLEIDYGWIRGLEADFVATLFAEAHIRGRVTDPSGSPIEGASIVTGAMVSLPACGAASAADGSFALRLAAPLRHTIRAERGGYRAIEISGYLPDEGTRLEITLAPRARATVRLLAGDPPAPVRGAAVYVFFPICGLQEPTRATSDANGQARFPFRPGEKGREMVFLVPDAGFGRLEIRALEDHDQDLGDLVLRPRHTLEVALTRAEGSPAAGIDVGLELGTCVDEVFRGLEWVSSQAFNRIGRSDASGRIVFLNLPAGTHSLIPPDGHSLVDERGLHPKEVRIPGDSPLALSVLPVARILGSVVDAEGVPVPEASVYVDLDDGPTIAWGSTDERGRFVLPAAGVQEDFDPTEDLGDAPFRLGVIHERFAWKRLPLPHIPKYGETIDCGAIEVDRGGILLIALAAHLFPSTFESGWELFDAGGERVYTSGDPGMPRDRPTKQGVRIDLLPAGTYRLRVHAPGYRPWESEPFAIVSGGTREIAPPLEPALQLAGTVVDAESEAPIEGASIHVGRPEDWRWDCDTDSEGRFRVDILDPGPDVLTVRAGGYDDLSLWVDAAQGLDEPIRLVRSAERKTGESGSVRLFLIIRRPNGLLMPRDAVCLVEMAESHRPHACSFSASDDCHTASVSVRPPFRFRVWGEGFLPSDWIDVTDAGATKVGPLPVVLRDGLPTRVTVLRNDGTPVAGAHVKIDLSSSIPGLWDGDTDPRGDVAFPPLPPWSFGILVEGRGLPRTRKWFDYDGRGGPIPIVVGRAAALACTLRFPAPRASLEIVLGAIYKDSVHDVSSPHSLRIGGIPPGTHELEILSADTGLAYMSRELAFAEGEPLTAEFDLPMGTIEGRLAAGARVMVRPVTSSEGNWLFADADPSGGFSITALPPGRYRVAIAGRVGIPAGQEIEVRDGETTHVEMKDRSWTLRGSIVAADRSPVRGAQVGLEDEDPFASLQSYDILASGQFAFFEVGEGKQTLIVTAPGFIPFRQSIMMDRDRTIAVVLEKGVPISVSVVDPQATDAFARVSWIAAGGSSGYVGLVGARSETWIPPSAVSLRFETESGATIDVPLVKAEGGGFAPARAVIPDGEED